MKFTPVKKQLFKKGPGSSRVNEFSIFKTTFLPPLIKKGGNHINPLRVGGKIHRPCHRVSNRITKSKPTMVGTQPLKKRLSDSNRSNKKVNRKKNTKTTITYANIWSIMKWNIWFLFGSGYLNDMLKKNNKYIHTIKTRQTSRKKLLIKLFLQIFLWKNKKYY